MRVIMISEKRLDELVRAALMKMQCDAVTREGVDVGEGGVLSFRRVNFDMRVLIEEIKKGETL